MIQMFTKKHTWLLLSLLAFSTAQAATLQQGSIVPIRLTENVNGNMANSGETIYFEVIEDIKADQELVIPKGTLVRGKVLEAVGRKSVGRGGKLSITPLSLTTSDGQIVLFEEQPFGVEGRTRTGATVAHVVAWGVLGFLAKGRAAFILRDTEYEATIKRDAELQPVAAVEPELTNVTENLNIYFDRYKKKINFRKGTNGKDFWLFIEQENGQKLEGLDLNAISITHAENFLLPTTIKPKQLGWNDKKGRYVAVFDYADIVRYAVPGTTTFTIRVDHQQGHHQEAALETKWKLK